MWLVSFKPILLTTECSFVFLFIPLTTTLVFSGNSERVQLVWICRWTAFICKNVAPLCYLLSITISVGFLHFVVQSDRLISPSIQDQSFESVVLQIFSICTVTNILNPKTLIVLTISESRMKYSFSKFSLNTFSINLWNCGASTAPFNSKWTRDIFLFSVILPSDAIRWLPYFLFDQLA